MKLLSFLFTVFISGSVFSQNKLALIVAVGQYPAGSGLQPIASVNDVKYIKAALNKNGFDDKNIQTLINIKATKAAILNGLTSLALKAKKNDIVVINFGCHGQQIRDQKTIELGKDEDDGWDEAMLPYDAKAKYNPTGYRGENHLRDDDLYPKLIAIRQKIGSQGSLLVMLDACYSGTGTRSEGFTVSRGEWVPFLDPENPIDSVINLAAAEAKQGFFGAAGDSISNMVVISGSGPHQENKQVLINNEELGSLSYSFYKAMSEMPPGNTYELLFEKIKATIQALIPDQVPVIEGNANQIIFSGKYTAKEERTFIRVGIKTVKSLADSLFTIDKGMMDNMMAGSTCKIYKAGSKEPFAKAIIKKVENFRSIGVSDKLLKRSDLYELKQDEENYGNLKAGVKLKLEEPFAKSSSLENQFKLMVQPYRFLTISDNADFQLAVKEDAGNKKALLTDRNNKLLWSGEIGNNDSLSAEDKKMVITNIKKAMRVKYLRTMPDGGDLAQYISAEIIPAKEYNPADGIILEEGDGYSLKIRNNSDSKLFYTVLDIYPDDHVEILYPYKGKEPSDYLIDNKPPPVIRKLSVSKGTPSGTEFLKIIVSKEPMDLRSVFEQSVQRAEMHSFQMVIDDLFNERSADRSTRADISSIKVEEIGIVTVHFKIK
jgi:metacaspase-1